MKKLLTILLVVFLASSLVLAQGKPEGAGQPEDAGQVGIMPVNAGMPEDAGQPEAMPLGAGMPEDAGQPEAMPVDAGKPKAEEKAEKGKTEMAGKPELKGLENALTKVTNENARAKLQANLEKIQARIAEKLQKRESKKAEGEEAEEMDVEIEEVDEETGDVVVKAKEPVKYFGFIKGKATKRYSVNAEGKIQEKAPWYRFLYADKSE